MVATAAATDGQDERQDGDACRMLKRRYIIYDYGDGDVSDDDGHDDGHNGGLLTGTHTHI